MFSASWGLVKARLLLKEIGHRGLGGFFLQREVHAFMTAVLLTGRALSGKET